MNLRRELRFFPQNTPSILARAIATETSVVPLVMVFYATGVISTAMACLPVFVGLILGHLPFWLLQLHFDRKYRAVLESKTLEETLILCLGMLHVVTRLLSLLVGLALASMVVTIGLNPYTWYALLLGGVSVGSLAWLYGFAATTADPAPVSNDESENDESENDESENDESENDESENDESELDDNIFRL